MRVGARERFAHGNGPRRARLARAGTLVVATLAIGIALIPAGRASARITTPSRPPTPAAARPAAAHPATAGLAKAASQRAIAAQAARQAIAQSAVPDTCSGAISPDTIYPCSTPAGSGIDTFTFTLASASDRVLVRVMSVSGIRLGFTVTAPDSSTVNCQQPHDAYLCATSQAGTYTLAVTDGGSAYTVELTALLSDAACAVMSPSFAAAPVQASLVNGQTGDCYTLDVPAASVLTAVRLASASTVDVTVYDAAGADQSCNFTGGLNCTVGGIAPYRVLVSASGIANSYQLEISSLTSPAGCVTTAQLTYGQVPDASSADPCRTLTVTKAGSYQVVMAGGSNVSGVLYASDGSRASCGVTGPYFCQLAVGAYHYVARTGAHPSAFGVVFIAADESAGCASTGDTGFVSGPVTGQFAAQGEELCLNLPTPSGKGDHFANQPPADGSAAPAVYVLDATGATACAGANGSFVFADCPLTGTAPFRVILVGSAAPSSYRFLVQRTDSTAGCATWPQSGFGGTWGATVTVAAGGFQCLVIPADQHSTGEMIDYSNPANVVNGVIDVYDPAGKHACTGHSAGICAYQAGVAYTAIISTTIGDTYHLVRRDVSQAATCAAPASTAVGGPSTTFTLASALDTRCYRVSAAAADKLWFSVRPPASGAGALLQVTDSSGHWLCSQSGGLTCKLTGSAQYQLIVTASNYAGVAITARLDTWRVGGTSGWAAECTAHHLIAANGFPLTSGTLTEQATAYCAVIDVKSIQSFDIPGTTTASYPYTPDLNVWTAANWDPASPALSGVCSGNFGQFGARCSLGHLDQDQQDLLLLDLGTAQGGTGYTMQGVCNTQCAAPPPQATLTQVSPAAQPAQAGNVLVITGANLSLDTKVALASNGTSRDNGSPASVNSAGTSLTVTFNTSGLTPGQYDMVLGNPGYTVGTPSPGYLPGAYTVTAAPPAAALQRFTAVSPARILDTRSGLGAAKAKVKAHATVTLTVAGKGGVPASNVTAVALEVTAVSPAAAGYLIAYPAGKTRPGVSDLNFASGQAATNLIVVPLNGGKASIYNGGAGTLDLTADVAGYYAGNSGSKLTTMTPSRLLNTTTGAGAAKAPVAAHGTVALTVTGRFAIPATGVTAVALTVTALSPKAAGALAVYPNGTSRPTATSLSFAAGQAVTSLVIVRLVNGKASLYNNSAGTVQLYADAVGYYSAKGSSFLPLTAQRVLDTRSGLGGSGQGLLPHASAVTRVASVAALAGKNVTAVALEVTVTGAQQAGSLTAFADSASLPSASSLRFAVSRGVTGFVIVPVVNGSIDFYNNSAGTIAVLADLVGYYTS